MPSFPTKTVSHHVFLTLSNVSYNTLHSMVQVDSSGRFHSTRSPFRIKEFSVVAETAAAALVVLDISVDGEELGNALRETDTEVG